MTSDVNILVHENETVDDSNERVTTYAYDALGRVIRTTFDDATYTESQYDALGRVITEIDQLGREKSYEFDALGRLIAVELPEVVDPLDDETERPRYEYGYDAFGNQTLIRDPIGTKSVAAGDRETEFVHDARSRQLSRTLPEGSEETFEYDDNGRMTLHISFEGVHTEASVMATSSARKRQSMPTSSS